MDLTKEPITLQPKENNKNKVKNFIETLNNLNPQEMHNWPYSVLTFIGMFIAIFILILGHFLMIGSTIENLDSEVAKEEKLKKEYEDKVKQAVNLDSYKKQLQEITIASDQLLKQLPDRSEIEKLLIYINQAGGTRGLKFDYFKPEPEKMSEFYAELPIKIKVTGTYSAIGNFATDISQLSRVVILKDINITTNNTNNGLLSMEATAKTFRYLDNNELERQRLEKKKEKDKNKKKPKADKEDSGHKA